MLALVAALVSFVLALCDLVLQVVQVSTLLVLAALPAFAIFYYLYKLPPSPEHSQFEKILIGHRGCRLENLADHVPGYDDLKNLRPMPENCLTSIRTAISKGVDAIEIDTHLSADNVPVVIHDHSLKRLCGTDEKVSNLTVMELSKRPLVLSKTQECAPTLEAVIKCIGETPNVRFMIEIKEFHNPQEMARKVIDLFRKYPWLYKRAYVASFAPQAVWHVRRLDRQIVSMLLIKRNMLSGFVNESSYSLPIGLRLLTPLLDVIVDWSLWTWLPSFLGIGLVGLDQTLVSREVIEGWQHRGIGVDVWTINNKAQRDFFYGLGAAVTSDYVFDEFPQEVANICSSPIHKKMH
jgi:glycerophosphoryl diester phosphodiesterase